MFKSPFSPNKSSVCCAAALALAFGAHARADVRFGYDGHAKSSVSFIEFNTATQDATLTQVSVQHKRLIRPTAVLVRLGSGANAGRWIKVQIDSTTGLVSRLTGPDNSRIDLTYSKTTGYRSALLVLRDNHGRQRLSTQITSSPNARQPMASKKIKEIFTKSPPDFYSWKDWGLAGSQQDVLNWDVGPVDMSGVGQAVAGMLDQTDHVINTLINRMLEIPELAHSGAGAGVLVARELAQTVAEASGMVDQAREYVGDLAQNLLDHGVSSPLAALEKSSVANAVMTDVLGRTVGATYTPVIPANGFAKLVDPGTIYKGGETSLKVVRQGGDAGILSGRILVTNNSGIRPADVSFEGGPYYVFLDGATTPRLLRMDVNKDPANGRTLALDLDRGDGTLVGSAMREETAPPTTGFTVAGTGGDSGASLGTATGCGFTSSLYLSGQVAIQMHYNAATRQATASVNAVIGSDYGSFDDTWQGAMTWNGSAFVGSLVRVANRPTMLLTIRPTGGGAYVASGAVPFTMYLYNLDGSCTGPVETFPYSVSIALH